MVRLRPAAVLLLWLTTSLAVDAQPAQQASTAQQYFAQGRQYQLGEGGRKLDLDKALRSYLQALRLDPQFFEAHVNAGQVYYRRKDYQRAKSHFSKAVTIARGRDDLSAAVEARISSDLGVCFHKQGEYEQAERWFRGAVGIDPTLVEGHYNLINLLLATKRQAEARQQLAVARAQAPSERYGIFEGRLRTEESYAAWLGVSWLTEGLLLALAGLAVGVPVIVVLLRRRKRPRPRRRRSRK